jgi:hypothetical protein
MQSGSNISNEKITTHGNGHNGNNGHLLPMEQNNMPLDSFEAVYLDPKRVHLEHQGENLTFTDEKGTFFPRVTLRRCFPLSSENVDILVRIPESEEDRSRELGILRDCGELDAISQESIVRELKLFYFVPQIKQVQKIKEEFGFLYWTVMTDRGQKEFIIRDNIVSSTRQISPHRWLLIDINQARYEIQDLDLLDAHSQDLVKRSLLL